jgi:metallophosphoesterase (TIGR00282 family)
MKILYIAEIVGKTGVYAYKKALSELKGQKSADFIIACADGATGGNGLGRNHAAYLHKLGAQVLTTGECCFYKKDLTENLGKIPYILRPENLNVEAPGIGSRVFRTGNAKVAVAVLLGQNGFTKLHSSSPFSGLASLLERLRRETPLVIVDFHAQATAEKQTFFAMAAGNCSAIIGSHCRVQTADEQIHKGTAFISDAGRTGSSFSVGGSDISSRIKEYITGIPDWTREAWEKPELQGVLVDIGEDGKARSIERIRQPVPEAPNHPEYNNKAQEESWNPSDDEIPGE